MKSVLELQVKCDMKAGWQERATLNQAGNTTVGMGCVYIEKQGLPILLETLFKVLSFMQHAKKTKDCYPF